MIAAIDMHSHAAHPHMLTIGALRAAAVLAAMAAAETVGCSPRQPKITRVTTHLYAQPKTDSFTVANVAASPPAAPTGHVGLLAFVTNLRPQTSLSRAPHMVQKGALSLIFVVAQQCTLYY